MNSELIEPSLVDLSLSLSLPLLLCAEFGEAPSDAVAPRSTRDVAIERRDNVAAHRRVDDRGHSVVSPRSQVLRCLFNKCAISPRETVGGSSYSRSGRESGKAETEAVSPRSTRDVAIGRRVNVAAQ